MAEVRVPLYRTAPGAGGVLCGAPVSASEWRSVAECYNWAAGRGRQLIAAFAPDHAALAKASTYWYALRVAPSYGALHRVWWITTRADTARGSADISLDSGTARGVSSNFFGTVPTEAPSPVLIERASVASQSTTHVTADLKFAPNEEAQFVDAISCWEIPRIKISSSVTAEHGVDASAFVSGASIDQETFGSIWNATNATEIGARALFHWAVPYRTTASSPLTTWASSTTSASFVDVMDSDVPILLRKLSVGNTTETLTGRVFWWTSDGTTTCEVRLTSGATNGTALSATPTTTPAWSDAFTVAADCEDLSEATGLQGGAFTVGGVEFRRTAGSGTLYVASAMAHEA